MISKSTPEWVRLQNDGFSGGQVLSLVEGVRLQFQQTGQSEATEASLARLQDASPAVDIEAVTPPWVQEGEGVLFGMFTRLQAMREA